MEAIQVILRKSYCFDFPNLSGTSVTISIMVHRFAGDIRRSSRSLFFDLFARWPNDLYRPMRWCCVEIYVMAEIPFLTIKEWNVSWTSITPETTCFIYQTVCLWIALYLGLCVEWKVWYQENNPLCLLSGIYGQMVISDVF